MGELFNRIKTGFLETWNNLEKAQRRNIIIITAISLLFLIGFIIYSSAPQWEVLYNSSDPIVRGKIKNYLTENGQKVRIQGNDVYVEKGKSDDLLYLISNSSEDILSDSGSSPSSVTSSSFLMTSEDKQQLYLQQRQESLRKTLKKIKGVKDVDVQLSLPDQDSFVLSQNEKEGTASVMVIMDSGASSLSASTVEGIRRFVAAGTGLKMENVEVMGENGESVTPSQDDLNSGTNSAYDLQKKYSNDIEDQLTKLLSRMFGNKNVEVIASVNINTKSEITNSTEVTPVDTENIKGIVSSMQDIRKNWVDPSAGGVPGTDTNTTDINQYVETDTGKAEYSEVNETINYEFNEIKKQIIAEVGNIEDLSLAITIDRTALKEGTDEAALKQELVSVVDNATKAFVPNKTVEQHEQNITIAIADFDHSTDIAFADKLKQEQAQQRMDNMIKIGSVVGFILVLIISMFLFIRRRTSVEAEEAMELQNELAATAIGGPTTAIDEIDIEDRNELKKKIEKFVGQKPDLVATLLKSWLNEE